MCTKFYQILKREDKRFGVETLSKSDILGVGRKYQRTRNNNGLSLVKRLVNFTTVIGTSLAAQHSCRETNLQTSRRNEDSLKVVRWKTHGTSCVVHTVQYSLRSANCCAGEISIAYYLFYPFSFVVSFVIIYI